MNKKSKIEFKFFFTYLLLFIQIISCSNLLKNSQKNNEIEKTPLTLELVDDHMMYLHNKSNDLRTLQIDLDKTIKPSIVFEAYPTVLKNILDKNVTMPEDLTTSLIKSSITFNRADRYLFNFSYERGKRIIIPYLTNSHNVLIKSVFLFDEKVNPNIDNNKNEESNFLISRNFMIQVPEKGTYNLYILVVADISRDFDLNIFVTSNQKVISPEEQNNVIKKKSCDKDLEYNLRHCIKSQCQVNVTKSFEPFSPPPGNIFINYNIEPFDNVCKITTSSSHIGKQICSIPIAYNRLFQDCLYPSKDPEFNLEVNKLNNEYLNAKNKTDVEKISEKIQNLYIKNYPLSMICLKELDFQFPDFSDLLKLYCKETKEGLQKKYVEWFNELNNKIALSQSSLQFRFSGITKSEEPNNDIIEKEQKIKTLEDSCMNKNDISDCEKLSSLYFKFKDYEGAFEINKHGCSLKSGVSCQSAGLALTRLKRRSDAIKYDTQGCNLKDEISCYNAACGFCFKNDVKNALIYFKKYIGVGAKDPMFVLNDPTIQCLQNTKEFQQFVKKTLAPKTKF